MKLAKTMLLLCLGLMVSLPLWAVETTFWQVGSFDDLLDGTLSGVSLTKEGELKLAPQAQTVFNPDETLALALASDRQGNLYIGTGHQGKVFRVAPGGKGSLFFTAQEPDIFAVAVGPDDAVYAASSPEGKIYRITPDGKSQVFFDPKTKYIWALTFDEKGQLYAGTGDRGEIFKIDGQGKGSVFFDSKQTHVMCLTSDRAGNLLAGSVPNGLIYRINPQGKAFVLYKADLPEIHDLAVDSEGRIYAAALGATGTKAFPLPGLTPGTGTQAPHAVTTVTVTASTDEDQTPEQAPRPPNRTTRRGASFNRPTGTPYSVGVPKAPQGQGALIRILPDYSAETIWSSKKESIFGLALRGKQVLFTTDEDGRIFEVNPTQDGQNLTLLAETHESLATRLLFEGRELYVATSNIARLIRLDSSAGREGTYESPVKDAKFISHWGVLAWRGNIPKGASLKFYARSGNSDRPDQTWSDWEGPYSESDGSALKCPPARYFQWKAVFAGTAEAGPVLDDVTVSYLNQNLPPQIQSLNVSTGGERTGPAGSSTASQVTSPSGATVTVTSGTQNITTSSGASGNATQPSPTILSWQADDPNGDKLTYSVYVKAADERQWHLLKDQLHQTNYTVEPNALPDGKYEARLVASDEESNPPSAARRDVLASAPFWIDNTPPQVQVLRQSPLPAGAEIHFQAADDTSPLSSAEVSQDGEDWHDIAPDDGMADSRTETFTIQVRNLAPGEHVIMLRAYDTAGNAGVGKALIQVPGGNRAQP